jgi:hypothetical protein
VQSPNQNKFVEGRIKFYIFRLYLNSDCAKETLLYL